MKYLKRQVSNMDILEDRLQISLKYKLLETTEDGWNFTKKCIDNYDLNTYKRYLKGDLEKPLRITKQTTNESTPKLTPQQEMRTKEYQDALDELFKL